MTSFISRVAIASPPISTDSGAKVIMPAWSSLIASSRPEQIIPLEVFPYVSRAEITKLPGNIAPGIATQTMSPTSKFVAPQIT